MKIVNILFVLASFSSLLQRNMTVGVLFFHEIITKTSISMFHLNVYFTKSNSRLRQEISQDARALLAIIGTQQSIAYCRFMSSRFKPTKSSRKFTDQQFSFSAKANGNL